MSKELNKALDLLREIRPSIPKDVLELWCKDRDAFLASHKTTVEQAGGDERAAFELFVRKHCGMPEHIAVNWDAKFTNDAWEGWQARAALAQPSPAQADEKPGDSILCYGCFAKGVGPDHFDEAGKCLARQQTEPLGAEFAQVLSDNLPELLSTGQAEQAEAERLDWPSALLDVAVLQEALTSRDSDERMKNMDAGEVIRRAFGKLTEIRAQHERIVGALRTKADQLREALEWRKENQAGQRELLRSVTAERDAALARVAELEKQEPVAHLRASDLERLNQPGIAGSAGSLWNGPREGFVPLYAAPVAQAQHSVPEGVTIERDVAGTIHIKVGDFDFIQLQYQRPYTDNASTWKLAERIASLLAAAPGKEGL